MSASTDTGSQEYFSFAAAWDTLARSAKQNDEKAFGAAASFLDVRPIVVLRGLSFMLHHVALIPEDESNYSETQGAMHSAAEVVSLIAVMLEHQVDDDMHKAIAAMR